MRASNSFPERSGISDAADARADGPRSSASNIDDSLTREVHVVDVHYSSREEENPRSRIGSTAPQHPHRLLEPENDAKLLENSLNKVRKEPVGSLFNRKSCSMSMECVPTTQELPAIHSIVNIHGAVRSKHENFANAYKMQNSNLHTRSIEDNITSLSGSQKQVEVPVSTAENAISDSRDLPSQREYAEGKLFPFENGNLVHHEQRPGSENGKLLIDMTDGGRDINANGIAPVMPDEESALHRTLEATAVYASENDNAKNDYELYHVEAPQNATFGMLPSTHEHISEPRLTRTSSAIFPSSSPCSVSTTTYNITTFPETTEMYLQDTANSRVSREGEFTTLPSDNTTVSAVTKSVPKENNILLLTEEEIALAYDKTSLIKSNDSIYYKENQKTQQICQGTSFERSQSFFSSHNQLNTISFDEDALIREFELQSLEDRMSASECVGNDHEYIALSRTMQLVSSLTLSEGCAIEQDEVLKFSHIEQHSPSFRCSKVSHNISSLSEEILFKDAIPYSCSLEFPGTPSTIKADLSIPENLKYEADWVSVTADRDSVNESVLLNVEGKEEHLDSIPHAHSDPALALSISTDREQLNTVRLVTKHTSQSPAEQELIPPLVSEEEAPSLSSSRSGSRKTPSSERNILTNGVTYMELETSSGGAHHTETDASSSRLTYTEADVSSNALKVSDQDFSSCSLPFTEAEISSNEFPCTEQDIGSSMMYADADTSSNGLPYNEPDDTSSGWPQIEIDTNHTNKIQNEIDTSSFGISSNEFDASSSVFDTSSGGLPYIECESTNRHSYRTLQSCSSAQEVDSLSAESSGVDGEQTPMAGSPPGSPVGEIETPNKERLKCFPF